MRSRAAPFRHLERGAEALDPDEAELPGRLRVAAAGDQDGAEPFGRRRAAPPLGERLQRMGGAPGAVALERRARRRSPRARPRRGRSRRRPARGSKKSARYGVCVGRGNRRGNGCTRIAVPPAATGGASRQSRSASPSPRYAALTGFGRSRGRNGVVGGMPITTASTGSRSSTPLNSVPRSSASACATDGGPPNTAAAVIARGMRSRPRLPEAAGGTLEDAPHAASRAAARSPPGRTGTRRAGPQAAACRAPATRRRRRHARRAAARARARCASLRPCSARAASVPPLRSATRGRTPRAAPRDRRGAPSRRRSP